LPWTSGSCNLSNLILIIECMLHKSMSKPLATFRTRCIDWFIVALQLQFSHQSKQYWYFNFFFYNLIVCNILLLHPKCKHPTNTFYFSLFFFTLHHLSIFSLLFLSLFFPHPLKCAWNVLLSLIYCSFIQGADYGLHEMSWDKLYLSLIWKF